MTRIHAVKRSSARAALGLALALFVAAAPPAAAQNQAPDGGPSEVIESITVIGNRARAEKRADELPVPVDVYGEVEIERIGEVDLAAALTKLAPSFNNPRNSLGDGGLLHPATLRGLSPDQTLVLINGKRRHSMAWLRLLGGGIGFGTGGTDLRAIPSAAISRVEVLRDGAAAQYGSDAIAGVINLVLRDQSEGGTVSVYAARTGESDGERVGFSFNGGLPLGSRGGFFSLTGEWYDEDPLERNTLNDDEDRTITDSSPEYDNLSLFFNSELPLGNAGEIYAFGGWSERDGSSSGAYRLKHDNSFGAFRDRSTHPVYPNGFLPYEESEIEDYSMALGWRGEIGGWDLDLSAVYGQSEFRFGVSNSINASIGAQYLRSNPGANIEDIIANAGPRSGDSGSIEFDQLTFNFDVRRKFAIGDRLLYLAVGLEHREEDYEQKAGDLASWSCGSGGGSVGGENYQDYDPGPGASSRPWYVDPQGMAGEAIAWCGFQGYPGYSPDNARNSREDRNSQAAYLDAEFELTDVWTLEAAVRWEDYSDAGSETTGKLATRFQLSDEFALRGAFSTGFRAPSLSQRGFNALFFDGGKDGFKTVIHAREGSAVTREFGVEELEHETSKNWSAGLIWTPVVNFRVSVDGYQTEIDDRVVRSNTFSCAGYSCAVPNLELETTFFFNGIDTRTKGIDAVAQYSTLLIGGDLWLVAGAHFNRTEIVGENLPDGVSSGLDFAGYFGGWPTLLIERGQPRSKLNLTANWERRSLGMTLRLNRYGRTVQSPLGVGTKDISAANIVDIEGRYDLGSDLRITLGVNNVFDELPEKFSQEDGAFIFRRLWGIRYPNSTPYGLVGRLFYARLSYSF